MATIYGTISAFNPITNEWSDIWKGFNSTSLPMESRTILKNAQCLWTVNVSVVMEYSPSSTFKRLFVFGIGIKDESPLQTVTFRHYSMMPVQ